MNNKNYRRILRGILILILAFSYNTVFAACPSEPNCPNNYDEVVNNCGFKLDYVGKTGDLYTFDLKYNSDRSGNHNFVECTNTFTISYDGGSGTISKYGTVRISVPESSLNSERVAAPALNVTVRSEDFVADDPCCTYGAEGILSTSANLGSSYRPITDNDNRFGNTRPTPISIREGNPINCQNNNYSPTSFEGKFCNSKTLAGGNQSPSTTHKFQCNTDITENLLNPNTLVGENYYVNKKYLYHEEENQVTGDPFTYHYNSSSCGGSGGGEVVGETPSCTVKCEEAVEAEFGPPVASKAGMCFEYKVRVTSRVNCYMIAHTDPPTPTTECCTPTPVCTSTSGRTYRQGGPSEDFDACVKKCDGGKYSKSCSNKCYKEVYGTAVPGAKLNNKFLDDVVASKMALNYASGDVFCRDSNGGLYWQSADGCTNCVANWYQNNRWGTSSHDTYGAFDTSGIPRHDNGNGDYCHDDCSWQGCEGNVYLCPAETAITDYEANMAKWNAMISDCNARATCSTTTAYVTISADYIKTKNNENVTITFPLSSGKNTVSRDNDIISFSPDTPENGSIILPNDPTDGEGILGCYKPGASEKNLYRLTWSFPGTWINNKTGEISYNKQGNCGTTPGSTCTWQEQKEKFCIPINAGSVNQDWWNMYYNKVIAYNHIQSSIEEQEVRDKCLTTTFGTVVNPNPSYSVDKWNIKAKTEKFGYFDWSIEMECFYALNSAPLTPKETDLSTIPEECITGDYRIRSIDLENVFPATNGDALTSTDTYGRLPGHNWTKYSNTSATSSSGTAYNNTAYFGSTAEPISYLGKIQLAKDTIYDDDVEYQFRLSPRDIRNIRKKFVGDTANENGFANFDENGFYIDANGVIRYYSDDIRSLSPVVINNNKLGGLSCNNMLGNTDVCE